MYLDIQCAGKGTPYIVTILLQYMHLRGARPCGTTEVGDRCGAAGAGGREQPNTCQPWGRGQRMDRAADRAEFGAVSLLVHGDAGLLRPGLLCRCVLTCSK
jgi:hypothetical protein